MGSVTCRRVADVKIASAWSTGWQLAFRGVAFWRHGTRYAERLLKLQMNRSDAHTEVMLYVYLLLASGYALGEAGR
jgi:hypothetical protein